MPVLVWGTAAICAAFLLHVLVWRLHPPRRHTRALLLLFLGTVALTIAGLALAPRTGLALPCAPRGAWDLVHLALYGLALTLGYVITYSAVEADSPSLVLLLGVADAGPAGLSPEALLTLASDEVLVLPRVRDLLRDGHAVQADGRYQLTAKGRRFVGLFVAFRALLGAGKGG